MLRPLGFLSRPFDFLAALLSFFVGLLGFLNSAWPPAEFGTWGWILVVEDAYLLAGGMVVMTSLWMRELFPTLITKAMFVWSVVAEMFAWFFIAWASLTISFSAWWLPEAAVRINADDTVIIMWSILWFFVAVASMIRFRDLRQSYRGRR